MVKITVPATSANLGAGFDTLGLALSLYNYIYIDYSDKLDIKSIDGVDIPTDSSNLIYISAIKLFELCGNKIPNGLKIEQKNNIPLSRGLGSSSACIIAGLLGANELLGSPMSKNDILNFATKLEGHPDNVAPALLGGMVTSVYNNSEVLYVKQEIGSNLNFFAIVPDFEMKTEKSRQILPSSISYRDAVFNISRAALFSASILQGKFENLRVASSDKLHQPYRLRLIPHSKEIFDASYNFGAYSVYLSGAGSSIISICDGCNSSFLNNMKCKLDGMGLENWKVLKLCVDNYGAKIE